MFFKKLDKKIETYQRELIDIHHQEVETMYKQIRGWRHDYRNHIQTLKVLVENGNIEEVKEYLDKLDKDLNTIDTVIKTGNAMADAILNSKISLAKSKDIKVIVDAHIPVKLKMSELDLCVIIGNLFDNAIEASKETKKKLLVLEIYNIKNTIKIIISNSFINRDIDRRNEKGFTTKGKGHGNGLHYAKNILNKNTWIESSQEIIDDLYVQTLEIKKD